MGTLKIHGNNSFGKDEEKTSFKRSSRRERVAKDCRAWLERHKALQADRMRDRA
jgi:hypothetical protein